jgi:hypothetical protein
MTLRKIVGALIILLVFGTIFAFMVQSLGWVMASVVLGTSIGIPAFLFLGIHLLIS